MIHRDRLRRLNDASAAIASKYVLYWMQAAQRATARACRRARCSAPLRYINAAGLERKLDMEAYVKKVEAMNAVFRNGDA
jgi:hypothetical protein